jgi:hypothetical protein
VNPKHNVVPRRLASPSKKRGGASRALSRFQADLFEKIQEVNRHWSERIQSEASTAIAHHP